MGTCSNRSNVRLASCITALGATVACSGGDATGANDASGTGGSGGGARGSDQMTDTGAPLVCERDFFATLPQDLAAFSKCTTIIGTLTFVDAARARELTALDLSVLTTVRGDLIVQSTEFTRLRFPALTTVDGDLRAYGNQELANLDLPILTSVGGELALLGSSSLSRVQFPMLSAVGNSLDIAHHQEMTSLELPALTTVGGDVTINDNDALTQLSLPSLATISGEKFNVRGNATLPNCQANDLRAQLTDYTGTVSISDNDDSVTCQ
jgi:hypothetical protein